MQSQDKKGKNRIQEKELHPKEAVRGPSRAVVVAGRGGCGCRTEGATVQLGAGVPRAGLS